MYICRTLLEFGADVNHRDQNGCNATFWATERDDASDLDQLILSGAYNEFKLKSEHALMTLAVNRKSVQSLRVLLDHGANAGAIMKNR